MKLSSFGLSLLPAARLRWSSATAAARRASAFAAALVFLAAMAAQAAGTNTLCVVTYNLRNANFDHGDNAWTRRRPLMRELLQAVNPDLIGTQEGVTNQLNDIVEDLPQYRWIGVGREKGCKGEHMAIFYRTSRLAPLATNHFWLSDTPEIPGSTTWGNANRRMVTWVKFLDRQTGREFYHFNTHFDYEVARARENSAKLVRSRVEALHTESPVILTGDFNVDAKDPTHQLLVQDGFFTDTWFAAQKRPAETWDSFNDFKALPRTGSRIDWILVRGKATVLFTEVNTFARNGLYPSDHCPVVAYIVLGE
jgi:endonuclease/exonuclease/phosphatase family metal-dependent hydrolase